MLEDLKKLVDETHAAREKVNKEANTKLTKHAEFLKKFKELKNPKSVKSEKDFVDKKKKCQVPLDAAAAAAAAQSKSTEVWEAKIKAAKASLKAKKEALAEVKQQWDELIAKKKAHNDLVKQLNPPGPETDKLMHKIDPSGSQWINARESELLKIEHDLNEEESAMNLTKGTLKLDNELLDGHKEALKNQQPPAQGKKR
jgi:hypothetical protein